MKDSKRSNTLLSASIVLLVATLLSRVVGFLREFFIATNYGLSKVTDAFYYAITIPELLNKLVITGGIGTVLLPVFVGYIANQQEMKSKKFYENIRNWIFLILFILCLIIFLLSDYLIGTLSPSLPEEEVKLTVSFLQIVIFSNVLLSLSGLNKTFLNANKIFAPSAFAPVIQNVSFIILFITLRPLFDFYALPISFLISIIIQFIFQQVYILYQFSIKPFSFGLQKDKLLIKLLILSFPAMLTMALTDLNVIIDRVLATNLKAGAVSSIMYANKLIQLPIGILGASIVAAYYPFITDSIKSENKENTQKLLFKGMKVITLISFPVTLYFLMYSPQIVKYIFEYGAFTSEATELTSEILTYYSWGLPSSLLILMLIRVFHGYSDIKTPVVVGAALLVLKVGLSVLLIQNFSYKGLVFSTSLVSILGMLALLLIVIRRLGINWGSFNYFFIVKTLGNILMTVVVLLIVKSFLPASDSLIGFILTTFFFFFLYYIFALLLRVEEINELTKIIKKKIIKLTKKRF
ncbi:murein biosynthesis integral membrane protein MurJ [Rossellomorea sp. NRS-1567]|uniref:murein biosynthesis integral membrane protein MurJ n=1 Tax=Rossellomorea sp. NRS-1567 TaxID=3233901 RepID=UPI003D267379